MAFDTSPLRHTLKADRISAVEEYEKNSDGLHTPLGRSLTREELNHWNDYCEIFKSRWGFDKILCEYIALCGGDLFEAEYSEQGESAYTNSVCLPIRNASYQMFMIKYRWPKLREMGLAKPLLDYGCGSGFLLKWLWQVGHENLYGFEPPGIQREIMTEVFKEKDIMVWDEKYPNKFKTIICLNVLEHVEGPMKMLEYFYSMSNRVIADICIDEDEHEQTPHIAPKEELFECRKILVRKGTLFDHEPHTSIQDRITKHYGPSVTN